MSEQGDCDGDGAKNKDDADDEKSKDEDSAEEDSPEASARPKPEDEVVLKSGDNSEEPGDYPFGLNPAGYTSRSMIVICK